MALINCPECQREISNKVKSCPHCGYPLDNDQIIESNILGTTSINFKKLSLKKIIIFSSIFIIIIGIIGAMLIKNEVKNSKSYKSAIELFSEEKYNEAELIFESLDNYKDSTKQIENCQKAEKEKADKEKAEEEKRKEEEIKKAKEAHEKLYTSEVKYCVKAIITLKNSLKNPESLQVHSFSYNNIDNIKYVDIDVSAQNGFGGLNRKVYTVTDSTELVSGTGFPSLDTLMYVVENNILTSDSVKLLSSSDGVDEKIVYELLEEYEKTDDKSLLN